MSKRSSKEILKQIVLVSVDFSIWGGYKQTTENDLLKMNATLPGGGVITKGSKKIFPGDSFTPFNSLKKEISRKLASIGVGALGGSARIIPNNQVKDVQNYLDDCKDRYLTLLQDFKNKYDTTLEAHINGITEPVVREIVERSVLTKSDAVSRFRLNTDVFKIIPDGNGDSLVSNLANKLLEEVATAAREAYDKSFFGKPRVAQRALNQVIAIRNKLAGLVVLDGHNIEPIVNSLDDVLNVMPKEGWIEGVNFSALIGLVSMLCEPEDMLKHAEKIHQGKASASIPSPSQPEATATPVADSLFGNVDEQVTPVQAPVIAEVVETVIEKAVVEVVQQATPVESQTVVQAEIETAPIEELFEPATTVQTQLTLVEPVTIEADDDVVVAEIPLPIVKDLVVPKQKVAAFF